MLALCVVVFCLVKNLHDISVYLFAYPYIRRENQCELCIVPCFLEIISHFFYSYDFWTGKVGSGSGIIRSIFRNILTLKLSSVN